MGKTVKTFQHGDQLTYLFKERHVSNCLLFFYTNYTKQNLVEYYTGFKLMDLQYTYDKKLQPIKELKFVFLNDEVTL